MSNIFITIPDKFKLRGLDGSALEAAVIPNLAQQLGIDPDAVFKECLACPDVIEDGSYAFDFHRPAWVTGENVALRYRGNAIRRDNMWFQKDVSQGLRRYGYTGWQWLVAFGTYLLGALPLLEDACDRVNAALGLGHNHWIVTRYEKGADCIGMQSDKTKDWVPGSCFLVIKLGAPRPFVFTQADSAGKDVEIFNQVLQPGTGILVSMAANEQVKHGVPAVAGDVGCSGSIVGRAIATEIPWDKVLAEMAKRA